ncbi:mfs sugar transporter [Diplodia corticola]|uniref:Mfs sugar transporter n=1 Tax=Diplodia corticola TaxID=236234 RepID=A0A1J9RG43_9PEZI|nr:mfs sugar transporter [Diplodia corticola]OJD39050.1 mfs sugar transporter [Diplodia corticola]
MESDGPSRRNPTPEQLQRITAPFATWKPGKMAVEIDLFVAETGLEDDRDYISRGAKLAQDKDAFNRPRDALEYREGSDEKKRLQWEAEQKGRDRFRQTWTLYALVVICSIGAAVQGWDESAVSSAQIYYQYALNIQGNILGLVNAAPYLCCAVTCWLNHPLNKIFGRRGTIFITCFVSFVTCLGQGFAQTWQQLFVARLLLGFGIGPKSATIPVFAAECAPANVRGALVMMWQMWTAAGIMFGYIAGVALHAISDGSSNDCRAFGNFTFDLSENDTRSQGAYAIHWDDALGKFNSSGILPPHIHGASNIQYTNITNTVHLLGTNCSLNWRMMLAAPMILPLVVMAYIYTVPESPRWLLDKKLYLKVWDSLCRLRHLKLQAGRDFFLLYHQLKNEREVFETQRGAKQLFGLKQLLGQPRSRRALQASLIVMFLQQFCGVNVHVYYSVSVFYEQAHFPVTSALLAGMGFGIINFLCALPAVFTIDTFGRRNLLLSTFPFMAIFQAFIAISLAAKGTTPLLLVGMYLFSAAYSPGEGPVPFVYSAESMPLHSRDLGMGIATAVLWLFNGILAITYPQFLRSFTPAGTFGWYAAWCFAGWFMILLFVPETKDLSLEQLDKVFNKRTSEHMSYGWRQLLFWVRRYVLLRKYAKSPTLWPTDEQDNWEAGSNDDRSITQDSENGHEMRELGPSVSVAKVGNW